MTTPASPLPPPIIPAQLGFLAIYNPSLGSTDETIDDQIVYYASVETKNRRRRHRGSSSSISVRPTESLSRDERNERLRQIGLAQGMVAFGKSFSGGRPVDSIDTERSRVVLHELEPGWWILASVDLTRLSVGEGDESNGGDGVEYSSREVKPAALLLRDLLRAHAGFLLHHDSSLSALFVRSQRGRFVSILGRYWDGFLGGWNVMLHGNPAGSVFGGIKIAASGLLGFGVGEEERGSGEREVLEGLVRGVEGMVDLVVGRFGEGDGEEKWLGMGREVGAEDGAVFLGVGALSKYSTRAIVNWMEDLYTWGEAAYGVVDSPTATRVQPRRKKMAAAVARKATLHQPPPSGMPAHVPPGLGPPPPVTSRGVGRGGVVDAGAGAGGLSDPAGGEEEAEAGMGKIFSYLKMGYGTAWTLGSSTHPEQGGSTQETGGKSAGGDESGSRRSSNVAGAGQFLVGLTGNVDETGGTPSDSEDTPPKDPSEPPPDLNTRIRLRTIIVELEAEADELPESQMTRDLGSQETELAIQKADDNKRCFSDTASSTFDSQDRNKTKKLRVVVYVHRPFIFILLFQLRTDSLAWDGLYRSLHHQLASLHKGLLASTAYRPGRPENVASAAMTAQIYDLIWDPKDLMVHSTIPSIPEPGALVTSGVWSRIEALNTHNQILNLFLGTRDDMTVLERTCKTSRGWWIFWNRVLEEKEKQGGDDSGGSESRSESESESDEEELNFKRGRRKLAREMVVGKEIFLIRKASDHGSGSGSGVGGMLRGVSGSYGSGVGSGGERGNGEGNGGWADGASRLAQGIGVDTRRYVEGLLSLNR